MDTEEVSDRFVAPCFVNGLEVYDGGINLGVEENMIPNEYAVKLCLEHEVKRGNKVVKKELIVALIGEIYFVKFIINPKEDDVEPGVILDDIPLLGEEGLSPFVCKMGKSSRNKKRAMENLNFFYQDIGTSSSAGGHLTQEEAAKEALAIRMSQKYALLYEERPIIETMAYHDKYKKILNEVWKDKVWVTTLIAKFLILYIPIDSDSPIVVGRGFLCMIGGIVNTPERLFLMFDGFCHQTSYAARSNVMRNAKSDSDDKEDYQIKRNKFGAPVYGPNPAPYLNCNDPAELWEHMMMRPDHQDLNAQDNMKPWKKYCFHKFNMSSCYGKDVTEMQHLEIDDMLRIRLCEARSDEEIFTSVAWIRAFNFNEPIYAKLCHKLGLYQAGELEEEGFNVYFEGGLHSDEHFNAQDYWLSISREENLGLSRSHTSTIKNLVLRVIHKMITYGLCQRTTGYDKVQKNDMWLLSMFDARHENRYANVAWVIARWMKRKGTGTQKESQICCGQFISKIARKDLDTITLRDLIDSDAYNPPGYAQPQYDKYYQQYLPPPLQYLPPYQPQQQDDDE
ncbi:hypothetical protein Tco_0247300 [Tanacetum coccineum]